MSYEFAYQSPKQKAVLLCVKGFVLLLLFNDLYMLGWTDTTIMERLSHVGGACIAFYIYANLLSVKIEVQELFVPPPKLSSAVEFLVVGGTLLTLDTLVTINNILRLHGIYLF